MSDNLYEPNSEPFISNGRFWRCPHGSTGWYACLRCGFWHPLKFLKHLLDVKRIM